MANIRPQSGYTKQGRDNPYPLGGITMRKRNLVNYTSRIEEIKNELKVKSLGEAERDRNISNFDYTGVGFGYNLKPKYPKTVKEAFNDISVPEFDKLASMKC
jgi:hypothetical protein